MTVSYQQTDGSASVDTGACSNGGIQQRYIISAGAAAGTISHSYSVRTAGALTSFVSFNTSPGEPGTATYEGSCKVLFNITTANTNVTYSELYWCNECALSGGFVTTTSALGISLGTTGIKTASIAAAATFNFKCLAISATCQFMINGSNGAMANAIFNFLCDQVITTPFTGAAPPPATQPYTLAQSKAGI